MDLFSERHGHQPARSAMRLDKIDHVLHVKIWDCVFQVINLSAGVHATRTIRELLTGGTRHTTAAARALAVVMQRVAHLPIDQVFSMSVTRAERNLKDLVLNADQRAPWWRCLDVYEVILHSFNESGLDDEVAALTERFNRVMESYGGNFRVVDRLVVPVTTEDEVDAVTQALTVTDAVEGAREHLSRMLTALSERPKTNYADVAQEAIDAVEAAARHVTGGRTLKEAIKKLRKNGGEEIHPTVLDAWDKLYGFRSDALQHGKAPHMNLAWARYFVIHASAFCSLLLDLNGDPPSSENGSS